MLKFKSANDENIEINVDNYDSVQTVKKKLSKKINVDFHNLVFISKNRILYDNKLISDYAISPEEYVLYDTAVNCLQFQDLSLLGRGGLLQIKSKNKHTVRCGFVGVIQREEVDRSSYKNIENARLITVHFHDKDSDIISTINTKSNETINDAYCNVVQQSNDHPRDVEFYILDNKLDENKSFDCSDIKNEDTILVINPMQEDSPIRKPFKPPTSGSREEISMISINNPGHHFTISQPESFKNILEFLSNRYEIPETNIKLYQNESKTAFVDKAVYRLMQRHSHFQPMKIYFVLIADIDNLIKCKLLGSGSFGKVYKCMEIGSNKTFALKEFNFPKDRVDEIRKEVAILNEVCNHGRIIQFERHIETDRTWCILMEYMAGGSLRSYLDLVGPLPDDRISKLSKEILEALHFLHGKNILHRDIKADNVLLDGDGNAKLCDFGLAVVLIGPASENLLNGASQSTIGTAHWMAPEIINSEAYGSKADIWSFGATMVEMLTGNLPCNGLTGFQAIYRIGTQRKLLFRYPKSVSISLKSFIESCLEPEPRARSSIDELMLHEFLLNN